MSNLIKSIASKKKTILLIILSPFMAYCFNVFVIFIFNLGNYFGTFIRCLLTGFV